MLVFLKPRTLVATKINESSVFGLSGLERWTQCMRRCPDIQIAVVRILFLKKIDVKKGIKVTSIN